MELSTRLNAEKLLGQYDHVTVIAANSEFDYQYHKCHLWDLAVECKSFLECFYSNIR